MTRQAKSTPRHFSGSLGKHPDVQPVLAHIEQILRVARLYQSLVPAALGRISRVANIKSGTVVIHANHGAAASKLKQMSRYMTEEFVKRGVDCTSIDVRVQAGVELTKQHHATQKPMSEQALAFMQNAAEMMGTDSPLRKRIEHLMEHAARPPKTPDR